MTLPRRADPFTASGHRAARLDVAAFPKPPEWMADALCAETDPEAFFPEKGGSAKAARKVCAVCPVSADCLAWSLAHGITHGVWAGTTIRQRQRMPGFMPDAMPRFSVDTTERSVCACGRVSTSVRGAGAHAWRCPVAKAAS